MNTITKDAITLQKLIIDLLKHRRITFECLAKGICSKAEPSDLQVVIKIICNYLVELSEECHCYRRIVCETDEYYSEDVSYDLRFIRLLIINCSDSISEEEFGLFTRVATTIRDCILKSFKDAGISNEDLFIINYKFCLIDSKLVPNDVNGDNILLSSKEIDNRLQNAINITYRKLDETSDYTQITILDLIIKDNVEVVML